MSLDWKWLFIYPESGVASVNHLVIPVGRPVHFGLTSSSVMNAFFVPRLGSMIYTMNGMTTQLNLQADHAGRYLGQSSQFSGDGFAAMRFNTDAVAPAAFDAWVARTPPERPGARPGHPMTTWRSRPRMSRRKPIAAVTPGLFNTILMRSAPHTKGPLPRARGVPLIDGETIVLGKLTWAAIPLRRAHSLHRLHHHGAVHPRHRRIRVVQGVDPLSVARMDHERRP